MNRFLLSIGTPEVALGVFTALLFAFCARHNSFEDRDVRLLERLLWLLPLMVVAVAFATLLRPELRTWWGLGRINLAVTLALIFGAYRLVSGFGAPGSGPKGQDAGFIVVFALGMALCAPANAGAAAWILSDQNPSFADWFRQRKLIGSLLTFLAALPLAVIMMAWGSVVLGLAGAMAMAVKR